MKQVMNHNKDNGLLNMIRRLLRHTIIKLMPHFQVDS